MHILLSRKGHIFFEKDTSFSVFLRTLASHFEISEQKIKLFEEERNAEIISTRSLDSKKKNIELSLNNLNQI